MRKGLPEVKYHVDDYVQEDVDVLQVQGECLVVQRVVATPRVRKDWRRHNFFRTRAFSGGKMCNLILDGGTSKNITSKQAIENLKLTTEKYSVK